jgi:probable O-glycosylation ligase (exosortase A-associated)
MGITTIFAWYPESAFLKYINVLKIQLVILFSLMLMGSKERIHMLLWVIFLSIGFYGIKGGLFTLLGDGGRVWGPAGSYIAGNNELALATLMILPIGNYLRVHSEKKWVRHVLLISLVLCLI